MARAYYNEIDKQAAQWLRNLITKGLIAPGDVDERSISDVSPDDLRGYTQCHFFAGIGVWSHALRRAGWDDSRPVWTGSCPCQPFSSAGAQAGFADERHLWPDFHWLIQQCRPPVLFGEQVASKAVEPWVDLVQADLEALGYAFGGVPFPSAGVGAPHIRDRLFWVGHADDTRLEGYAGHGGAARRRRSARSAAPASVLGGLGYPDGESAGRDTGAAHAAQTQDGSKYGDSDRSRHAGGTLPCELTGPVNGLWSDADWLFCRDGKWRPVEPGTFPLAHGAASRVVRLRAYGNAINAEAATQFIGAYLESVQGLRRADLIELDPLI